jgi:hypothetical protein
MFEPVKENGENYICRALTFRIFIFIDVVIKSRRARMIAAHTRK